MSKALPPLTPAVFHILLTLADQERHGYGIMQEIAARTAGAVRLGPGTLYGLIAESAERPASELDDERRRYYWLTERGRQVAAAEAERLAKLVRLAGTKCLLEGA
jgi:DNA-binding PadR family transcriptional regulator